MKFVTEFRDEALAKNIIARLHQVATKPWTIMEVCGGQTHTILQYGIQDMIPKEVELVHGPGCPVCVTPVEMVDRAIAIASDPKVIFCTFGDMLRVPGTKIDLATVRSEGADVRILYSPIDAVKVAKENPDRKIVLFAVGFETTAPANAMAIWQAKQLGLTNFFALVSHVTVPPVVANLLEASDNRVQAFIGPGHVCTVMGVKQYEELVAKYHVPIVVSGFEPIDLLDGILHCVEQLENKESKVENRYARSVREDGATRAQDLIAQVFQITDRTWRGLGVVPQSGYRLADEYRAFDAEIVFNVEGLCAEESPVCISGEILRGLKKPPQCPAFGTTCTPETPLGATMVSSEGTCTNYYKFAALRKD
jgi:hydrogenase expression/formation protein HypD